MVWKVEFEYPNNFVIIYLYIKKYIFHQEKLGNRAADTILHHHHHYFKKCSSKPKKHPLQVVRGEPPLVLGAGANWESIERLRHKVPVGRWYHLKMSGERLKLWAKELWFPFLKYRPKVSILYNGWVVFHFLNSEDVDQILKESWVKGWGFLITQQWKAWFGPFTDAPRMNFIWENLSRLPLEPWNVSAVTKIANRIVSFYYWDEGSFGQLDKRMTWGLVEMELGRRLIVELEIGWSSFSFNLAIDYWGLP